MLGGRVWLQWVCGCLQEEVAIKMVSRGVANARAAEREIANLRLCALHPYIIHMHEACTSSMLRVTTVRLTAGYLS